MLEGDLDWRAVQQSGTENSVVWVQRSGQPSSMATTVIIARIASRKVKPPSGIALVAAEESALVSSTGGHKHHHARLVRVSADALNHSGNAHGSG